MNHDIVLKTITKIIIPFIMIYAFYLQIHGEVSPGGGFQAGAVLASVFMLHSIIFNISNIKFLQLRFLEKLSITGVLIYLLVGLVPMFFGGNYLNYYYLNQDKHIAQKMGIMLVELGVGMTVFSVMLIIFFRLKVR